MKVDKGFSFSYWNLSYRRKMIRTLWLLPVIILFPVALNFYEVSLSKNLLLSGVIFIVWLVQLIYNYIRYKKEKDAD